MAEVILDVMKAQGVRQGNKSSPPPLIGWSAERADFADLKDIILAWAAHGEKYKPVPRPRTAIEVVRERRKNAKMSAVEAKITGKG